MLKLLKSANVLQNYAQNKNDILMAHGVRMVDIKTFAAWR